MKKILLVISLVLVMIIPCFVYADTLMVSASDDYISFTKNQNTIYKKINMINRNSDNRVVYQLNLDDILENDSYMLVSNYSKINKELFDRIQKIAYYGYNYYGHSNNKWYTITQFLIWKEMYSDLSISFSDDKGNVINKYEDEIEELTNLVDKHDILPSFACKTFKVDNKERLSIVDTNNVLDTYHLNNNNGLKITIKDNTLTLLSDLSTNKSIFFIKHNNIYSNKPEVYVDNNDNEFLLPGKLNQISFSVIFRYLNGNIKVNILDKDTNSFNTDLIDTQIDLIDSSDNIVLSRVVKNNPYVVFENIKYGSYKLRVSKINDNYKLIDDVVINLDDDIEIDMYNEKKENNNLFVEAPIIRRMENTLEAENEIEKDIEEEINTLKENEIIDSIEEKVAEEINNIKTTIEDVISLKEIESTDTNLDNYIQEIDVPNTYILEKDYSIFFYCMIIILGLLLSGRKNEKI